jgi:uncharacterized membrane protein
MSSHKNLLSELQREQLVQSIKEAEKGTRGEIRIHIEDKCKGHPLHRAHEVFMKLKMQETKERTGVIIYLAAKDRKFAIYGDKGIDEQVHDNFWETIKENAIAMFKKDLYFEGLSMSVVEVSKILRNYFPASGDNPDELSNEISFGDEA